MLTLCLVLFFTLWALIRFQTLGGNHIDRKLTPYNLSTQALPWASDDLLFLSLSQIYEINLICNLTD